MDGQKNGQIEVYDQAQRCWIPGHLCDIEKTRVQVQFQFIDGKRAGQPKWFDWSVVRETPTFDEPFVLQEGQTVEVCYNDPDSKEEPAWWEAKIVAKKGPFCKVHFLCGSFPDEAVDEELIRPSTAVGASAKPMYTKQTVPIKDPTLHAWFLQNEATIMTNVREKAQLLAINVEASRPQLKLIGSSKSISMAKMLIELHMKHHNDMERIHADREKLALRLDTEKAKRETGVRIEFPVDKELIGLVVGKNGKNIQDAKRQTGIDVVEVDQSGPRVVIIGPTAESVEAARELLEFVTVKQPVEQQQIGWLIGKGGRNFKELQEKTKVTRLNVDKTTNTIMLVGTATAVAAAQLYIDTHLEYLAEFDKVRPRSTNARTRGPSERPSDFTTGVQAERATAPAARLVAHLSPSPPSLSASPPPHPLRFDRRRRSQTSSGASCEGSGSTTMATAREAATAATTAAAAARARARVLPRG